MNDVTVNTRNESEAVHACNLLLLLQMP